MAEVLPTDEGVEVSGDGLERKLANVGDVGFFAPKLRHWTNGKTKKLSLSVQPIVVPFSHCLGHREQSKGRKGHFCAPLCCSQACGVEAA